MKAAHKIRDIFTLAIKSIVVHWVRSALTALGIIFGVWGVIAMMAINAGASAESQRSLRELGTDNIIITSIKPSSIKDASAGGSGWILNYGLTHSDVKKLLYVLPNIINHVVIHSDKPTLHYNGRTEKGVSVMATEAHCRDIARVRMVRGRFISVTDSQSRPKGKKTCVLTSVLAKIFFGVTNPVGKDIMINGTGFKVVGIMEALPKALAKNVNADMCVIIPLSTSMMCFGETRINSVSGQFTAEKTEVSQLILQMRNDKAVTQGAKVARKLLEDNHEVLDYEVYVPLDEIRQKQAQQRLWNISLFFIAGISLFVGGIGTMNIMLASVTERTREIGIRRAMGARRIDITIQFLVEAVVLTTLGGLIGTLIGWGVPWAIEHFLGFSTVISVWMMSIPLVMVVFVGLASGLYPAIRAARLDPITALRHE